ncbi:MAG: SMC family ATPase [Candidatus Micrarchaeota archaeon]
MITSLELKNWRSHEHTKLQFGKGTNLIVGIMGSGKSAILDGICYALYGTFPALRRKSVGMEDVLRHGGKEAQVALEFVHGGKNYRVVRALRLGREVEAAAKMYEDGKVLESGQSRVSAAVEERLGFGFDLFSRAVYSEQNNIGYFLELDAGRRKREMDGLMGLDRFEEARANIVRVMNRLEGERKALMQKYDGARHAEIAGSLGEKRRLLREAERKAERAELELEGKRKEARAAEKELIEMKRKKERKERAGEALGREKARVEALEADLEGKEAGAERVAEKKAELGEAEAELEGAGREIAALEKEESSLLKESGELEGRMKNAEKARREKEEAVKALERILGGKSAREWEEREKGLELEMVELGSQAKSLLAEAEDMEKYLGGLEGKACCPVCGSELGKDRAAHIRKERAELAKGKRAKASGLRRKVSELERELLYAKKTLREAAGAGQKARAEIEDAGVIAAGLGEARKRIEGRARKIAELKEKRRRLEGRARELLLALREMEGLLEKRKNLEKARGRASELEEEWKSIAFSVKEYERLDYRARELMVELERAEGKAREARGEIISIGEIVGVLEKEAAALEAMGAEIRKRGGMLEQLAIMKNAISGAQAELRGELVEAINAAMNGIWPILYPYADYRQLRIAAGEEDYAFEVYDGEWRRLEKVASGGERACLSLTLRIALATVLAPGAGLLMLDEPTHNLDGGSVQALAEALESRVPQLVEQAFVITHEENLMNSEFARSYRFTRDKETGGATAVEEL